ncbi:MULTISPECIES: efflux RND transporter periplasmic adaptor subunit [Rhizobium/Agrobacterium group]|uniref:RND multidrug efflux membrane permease n=2 Tax=Rhizobium/Agrobacterium group TaxID=227290 RepID=B9K1L3_ALLAM|nr:MULTISPECIES: efflux RND transporter periplasmic adaptor subunit [Rhizobium/Agrobacterium group]ACM38761.1 RND multidrug efflux membrane permease [Allorhizobium ampelinum S4]MBF2713453.1 efflux RND transporter periplasmic adaptor subunit [Agrobacterium vitis]MCF1445928.1 efflux RND transporter periplasmic adaptor subunit [Allorhizobium ampelinum]MCF1463162.1 efflux RND transporter periplasmic adaptor subunit [Allorhizobium ampelinum]MCF1481260.1 efflux RND transporter periplasmic adaptor su
MQKTKRFLVAGCAIAALSFSTPSFAQMPNAGPPAVGVTIAKLKPINDTTEVNGRVEAKDSVNLVARVTGFLEEQLFKEGSEVKKGQVLFRIERQSYEADLDSKKATLAENQATLENSNISLARNEQLRAGGSGSQSNLDDARATQRTSIAKVAESEADVRTSQINLGYTDIIAPIDGRIGLASVTVGNVVSSSSGTLATVVSQDPMYVKFPISVRRLIELRQRFDKEGGLEKSVKLKIRLPDGRLYAQEGTLDFYDISVSENTDSITLRGTIPNPLLPTGHRELVNDEFVRVILETVEPTNYLTIPRASVMIDQQGSYVYVVDDKSVAQVRRVTLGQSTPDMAVVTNGLKEGDKVITDGIQRVRPNTPVNAQPADQAPSPAAPKQG